MQVWLVKKAYKEFDETLVEVVDAFKFEDDANAEELNLTLRITPEEEARFVFIQYYVEPLEVKDHR